MECPWTFPSAVGSNRDQKHRHRPQGQAPEMEKE